MTKWIIHRLLTFLLLALAVMPLRLAAAGRELQLVIVPRFSGLPVMLDSLRYQNTAGETLSVTRLSYLLSGFALERDDGVWVELPEQYAWLDAVQHREVVNLTGITAGKYRSLRFHLGPDPAANAAKPEKYPPDHPLNPNLNGLHWSWQGGYIFLALEGNYRVGLGELKGYAFHLARDPNRTRINLTVPLDLTRDAGVQLDFDLSALFNAPHPLSFEKDGVATHSRDGDPVSAALAGNLRGAFSVRQVMSNVPAIAQASPLKPLYLPAKFTPYRFTMSSVFPIPELPRDNPLLEERVALGKKLFHEPMLSRDDSISCSSCHQSNAALADPRAGSLGVRGQVGTRNAMPLYNLAWKTSFFWDGRAPSLRAQALMPIQDHTEMDETLERVTGKLAAMADYPPLFQAAFGSPEITSEKLGLALEQYLLTLTSYDAKFDRALRGQVVLSAEEQRGFELFMTEYEPRTGQYGADCFHCHGGPLFSDFQFHNNGIASTDSDTGRLRVTGREADRSKFSTPSLRNVALTAPYMHDGRFATLEQVVEHYTSGVKRTATLDPNLAKHPDSGLPLSAADKRALVLFLKTLTDTSLKQYESQGADKVAAAPQ